MKQLLNKTAYNFSVSLILIPFFIILNFLNKKESKVICKREFEIILLQTQSLSIKPYLGRVHNLPRGGAMVILRGGHHFLTLQ